MESDGMEKHSGRITKEDLVERYGAPVADTVLAEYLERDVRTIRKHAHRFGGRELIPGIFLFTQKGLDEVILKRPEDNDQDQRPNESNPRLQKTTPNQSKPEKPVLVIGPSKVKGGKNGKLDADKHGLWTEIKNERKN